MVEHNGCPTEIRYEPFSNTLCKGRDRKEGIDLTEILYQAKILLGCKHASVVRYRDRMRSKDSDAYSSHSQNRRSKDEAGDPPELFLPSSRGWL